MYITDDDLLEAQKTVTEVTETIKDTENASKLIALTMSCTILGFLVAMFGSEMIQNKAAFNVAGIIFIALTVLLIFALYRRTKRLEKLALQSAKDYSEAAEEVRRRQSNDCLQDSYRSPYLYP